MTKNDARKLKVGQRLSWSPDSTQGTVRETSSTAIKIEWDDGKWGLWPLVDSRCPWEKLELASIPASAEIKED